MPFFTYNAIPVIKVSIVEKNHYFFVLQKAVVEIESYVAAGAVIVKFGAHSHSVAQYRQVTHVGRCDT